MKTNVSTSPYKGYRFPPEIISHCVWLYFRFSLSFRDIEEIMAERGVVLTYETIRQWRLKFVVNSANVRRFLARNIGIDPSEPEKAAPQADVCAPFL